MFIPRIRFSMCEKTVELRLGPDFPRSNPLAWMQGTWGNGQPVQQGG